MNSFTHKGYKFYYQVMPRTQGTMVTSPTGFVMAIISAFSVSEVKAWIKQAKLSDELSNLIEIYGFQGHASKRVV